MRLRAERRVGELLKELAKNQGTRTDITSPRGVERLPVSPYGEALNGSQAAVNHPPQRGVIFHPPTPKCRGSCYRSWRGLTNQIQRVRINMRLLPAAGGNQALTAQPCTSAGAEEEVLPVAECMSPKMLRKSSYIRPYIDHQVERACYYFYSGKPLISLGWLMGLEPTTTGITILDSTN